MNKGDGGVVGIAEHFIHHGINEDAYGDTKISIGPSNGQTIGYEMPLALVASVGVLFT